MWPVFFGQVGNNYFDAFHQAQVAHGRHFRRGGGFVQGNVAPPVFVRANHRVDNFERHMAEPIMGRCEANFTVAHEEQHGTKPDQLNPTVVINVQSRAAHKTQDVQPFPAWETCHHHVVTAQFFISFFVVIKAHGAKMFQLVGKIREEYQTIGEFVDVSFSRLKKLHNQIVEMRVFLHGELIYILNKIQRELVH